ncbi:MAG: hypothetical protein DMF72_11875 [Acidobacteria bacterium]|nr:MAG: hypothetical protein DMF72_11875 [Acidobacteriota bacterium]
MARKEDFNRKVPLPTGLTTIAIQKAIDYIEKELTDLVEVYLEQANVFSALVGIYGTKALDATSVYEKHRHLDVAQQRFPDLRKKGSGSNPSPLVSLESKASKRPWALQSHYDHSGWYIVWRYLVDPTMSLEANKPVIIWRVDVVFLTKEDWKYEASTAGSGGGGRTHTFGLRGAATKLKNAAVYQRKDVRIIGGKAVPANGD